MATRKDGSVLNVNEGRSVETVTQEERSKEQGRVQEENNPDALPISNEKDGHEEEGAEFDDEELQESDFDIDEDDEETGGEG